MSEKDFSYAVFIGRFQPFHNGHLEIIEQALSIAENLILFVGSAGSSKNIKNPFTFEQRKEMISNSLTKEQKERIIILPVRDYYYNESNWVTEVQAKVAAVAQGNQSIALIGSFKDSSSYYLNSFPQWEFVPGKNKTPLNATDLRLKLFGGMEGENGHCDDLSMIYWVEVQNSVPKGVRDFLQAFITNPEFNTLCREWKFIVDYKKAWDVAPYPPTFVTADAIVIQSGHILVVKRKFEPGKGLYALPGGFIKQDEMIELAAIRELKEETGLKVHAGILKNRIVDQRVFDHPDRSLRGRTITHAFCIKLEESGELPEIKSGSDAAECVWMPLIDVFAHENLFFEDHAHIIRYFVNKF